MYNGIDKTGIINYGGTDYTLDGFEDFLANSQSPQLSCDLDAQGYHTGGDQERTFDPACSDTVDYSGDSGGGLSAKYATRTAFARGANNRNVVTPSAMVAPIGRSDFSSKKNFPGCRSVAWRCPPTESTTVSTRNCMVM